MSSSLDSRESAMVPVTVLTYPDVATADHSDVKAGGTVSGRQTPDETLGGVSEAELALRIKHEREQAAREVESRMRQDYETKLHSAQSAIAKAIESFNDARNEYFTRVEAEVVQLSLSIAAKILHREAQVDPMLVAALVKIAIEKMKDGTSVTVEVNGGCIESWKAFFAGCSRIPSVKVVANDDLDPFDCILETELGSASFGLQRQLKEVEQGFFDLLALRPPKP